MRYLQIPAKPGELWNKIKIVLKYFLKGGQISTKLKMHLDLMKALDSYKRQNLIAFRSYFIYILPYVSKELPVEQKHTIVIYHYTILKERFSDINLQELFTSGIKCYAESDGGNNYAVFLQAVTSHLEFEGSMCLLFKISNITLFTLSFTIVPGQIFNCKDSPIIYISSVQGAKNEFENIKKATKCFKENALPVILFKILQAIALRMDIHKIIGISVANQLSLNNDLLYDRFFATYDAFWINNGGALLNGNYVIGLPIVLKPLHLIAQAHRNRTVKKRKKLYDVYNYVYENMNHIIKNRNTTEAYDYL